MEVWRRASAKLSGSNRSVDPREHLLRQGFWLEMIDALSALTPRGRAQQNQKVPFQSR